MVYSTDVLGVASRLTQYIANGVDIGRVVLHWMSRDEIANMCRGDAPKNSLKIQYSVAISTGRHNTGLKFCGWY